MLEKTYSPQAVEEKIYQFWEDNQLFRPEATSAAGESFTIVIPPPNVTGTLHMGHALDTTLQDILIRWNRMSGKSTLWMPGTDHAGIATQNVVERQLTEQGLKRTDLGREQFTQKVWTWAKARKQDITQQFKRLGISPDWSRERFTLDEGCSRAVREAFVTLFKQGLIYKGYYIVNWSPKLNSAISDIETEYVEEDSFLWQIRYPLSDGTGELIVATTRPETLYGDVAVAVHPEDERYAGFIGKTVRLPLTQKEIPVIADTSVQIDFGTGALKITPAHDANDFEVSQRHQLKPVWVLDTQARIFDTQAVSADETGELALRLPVEVQGLDRFVARQETERMLHAQGYLVKKEPHHHSVGHCQRSGDVVEPYLSHQWFVRCKPIAEKALARYERGELRFVPERWSKTYLDWMTNLRDWCISRQLWWGHQIPAWVCQQCEHMTVSTTDATVCEQCQSPNLVQETDVLDTWFSSGLWPFSTMGWPDKQAPDFLKYYPTSVLVTGFDIIFFWVARMVLFGEALTDTSPFHTVFVHGLIRDEHGQKMSKSKGNTLDPVVIINEYGCDALRFSLINMVTYGGQDIKLSQDSFDKGRLFANKLWNASRFVLMNLEGVDAEPIDIPQLTTMDQWILTSLSMAVAASQQALTQYRFAEYTETVHEFIWNTFCDWYVEYAKAQLKEETLKANTQRVLRTVLENMLQLLHPVMPHITEEIWQKLPHRNGLSISITSFPRAQDVHTAPDAFEQIAFILQSIRAIRNVRQTSGIAHSHPTAVYFKTSHLSEKEALEKNPHVIQHFVRMSTFEALEAGREPVNCATALTGNTQFAISLEGAIDWAAEKQRQQKKMELITQEMSQLSGRLANEGFVAKAPVSVVEKDRARLAELEEQLGALHKERAKLS
jgi:valyl-tRNA synthetase